MTILIQRKKLISQPVAPVLQSGIQAMYDRHGKTEGHVCGDCTALKRNKHVSTICECINNAPRSRNMRTDYENGTSWRGHWQACGAWNGITRKKYATPEEEQFILDLFEEE